MEFCEPQPGAGPARLATDAGLAAETSLAGPSGPAPHLSLSLDVDDTFDLCDLDRAMQRMGIAGWVERFR